MDMVPQLNHLVNIAPISVHLRLVSLQMRCEVSLFGPDEPTIW